jgi:hypothetical protein
MSPSLNQFNATLQQWIDSVNEYSLAMLQHPPREGSWFRPRMIYSSCGGSTPCQNDDIFYFHKMV